MEVLLIIFAVLIVRASLGKKSFERLTRKYFDR